MKEVKWDKIKLKLPFLILSLFLWNNFMVIMIKFLINGLMVFLPLSSEISLKLKILIENGWSLMVQLMLFGFKTWTLYSMIIKNSVSIQVKLLLWADQWILSSSQWIYKQPVQLQYHVVVWFICNQNQWDGEYYLIVGWIHFHNISQQI